MAPAMGIENRDSPTVDLSLTERKTQIVSEKKVTFLIDTKNELVGYMKFGGKCQIFRISVHPYMLVYRAHLRAASRHVERSL